MKSKLFALSLCVLLAACADIKETGISRASAIAIAKQACPEYPDRFGFVDRAQWIPEKGFWLVLLDNQSGSRGRIYRIDRNGQIVSTTDINKPVPPAYYGGPYYGYGDPYYGPGPYYYGGPPVVVGVYGRGGYYHHWH